MRHLQRYFPHGWFHIHFTPYWLSVLCWLVEGLMLLAVLTILAALALVYAALMLSFRIMFALGCALIEFFRVLFAKELW